MSPALRSGVILHSLVLARPAQVEAGCFDFEEYLLLVYYQVNIATSKTVEWWTIISDQPVFVTVVSQSATRPLQPFSSWPKTRRSCYCVLVRPDIPHQRRTCFEYGGTERTSLRQMCLLSILGLCCWRGADGRPWRSTVLRLQMDSTQSGLDTGRRQGRTWVFA